MLSVHVNLSIISMVPNYGFCNDTLDSFEKNIDSKRIDFVHFEFK